MAHFNLFRRENVPRSGPAAYPYPNADAGLSEAGLFEPWASPRGIVLDHGVRMTATHLNAVAVAENGFGRIFAPLGYDLSVNTRSIFEATCAADAPGVNGYHTAFPAFEVWLYTTGMQPSLIYFYDPRTRGYGPGDLEVLFVIGSR